MSAFQAELQKRSMHNPNAYISDEQRRKLLEEMIEFQVLLTRAREAGYDRDPEIKARINQFIVSRFQEDQLEHHNGSNTVTSDAEVQAYYEQHQEQFSKPAAMRFGIIEFKISPKAGDEKRAELRQRAELVVTRARAIDQAEFARLAQQHSEDQATRYAGGDTGWMTREDASLRWGKPLAATAFELSEAGNVAPLIETPSGFYIVRLLERRAVSVRPFSEVKSAIAYQLARQRQFERDDLFRENMRRGLTIETNPDFLKLTAPTQSTVNAKPPGLPGG